MKLYATVTSERATKGQGGKDLMIEIYGEDREEVCRIKVTRPPFIDYLVQVFPVAYPQKLMLEVKGHGYELKRKGNKQTGESRVNDLGQFTDIQ